jgi:hypothetical protein
MVGGRQIWSFLNTDNNFENRDLSRFFFFSHLYFKELIQTLMTSLCALAHRSLLDRQ